MGTATIERVKDPAWASPRDEYIRPSYLFSQVVNTAPFLQFGEPPRVRLSEAGDDAFGYLKILAGAAALEEAECDADEWFVDYFAFCLAAHHATVATLVPTDVDTKIRGRLWWRVRSVEALGRMFVCAMRAHRWSISGISTRATELSGVGPVSGHDGELLGVFAGALGAFLRAGAEQRALEAAEAIDAELRRQAGEFAYAYRTPGCELDVLRLAATLTHNAGDLDQGISFWGKTEAHEVWRARFGRLAHENRTPYQGWFAFAADIYKRGLSAEGHRHYPLRAIRALRRSRDFLLPLGPFFDDWGAVIATHPRLSAEERAETVGALLNGCRKIAGQRGYYRALAGFFPALKGSPEAIIRLLPTTAKADWKRAEIRREISVPQGSFESRMKKLIGKSPAPGVRSRT